MIESDLRAKFLALKPGDRIWPLGEGGKQPYYCLRDPTDDAATAAEVRYLISESRYEVGDYGSKVAFRFDDDLGRIVDEDGEALALFTDFKMFKLPHK